MLIGSGDAKSNGFQIARVSQFTVRRGDWWRLRKLMIRRLFGLREKAKEGFFLFSGPNPIHDYGNSLSHGNILQFCMVEWSHLD